MAEICIDVAELQMMLTTLSSFCIYKYLLSLIKTEVQYFDQFILMPAFPLVFVGATVYENLKYLTFF